MHAQVVTFGLNGITEEQFREACEADTQTFANLPGLLAKVWLRDPESNTYGGLYLWADQQTYERYIKGEVFDSIKADQNLNRTRSELHKATSAAAAVKCGAYRRHVASLTEVRNVFARCDTSSAKAANASQVSASLAEFNKQMRASCAGAAKK